MAARELPMFDVGFSELFLLAVVALIVLGPEKLPHAARMTGAWVGRIRRMVISVQAEIEKEVSAQEMRQRIEEEMRKMRESELADSLREEAQALDQGLHDLRQAAQGADQASPADPVARDAQLLGPDAAQSTPAASTGEPAGEDAFKAHVQSSYNRILPEPEAMADNSSAQPKTPS